MEDFLIYIGKVSIAAGVFYLAYLILFQKQKHFGFNRIYLPVSMLVSFVIPVITFTTIKYVELPAYESSPLAYSSVSSSVEYVAPAFEFEWYHYLFGLYILGVAGFFLHLLFGHLKAMHIIRTSKIQQLFDHIINITRKDVHPFSFFNKIVLSEKTLSSPDLEMIVDHEKIHVREKHTFDILFTEILFLLQWFNPFAWLIKGAVRNNLEYKTDDEIAKIYDPQKYQLAMVALADKKEVAPFLTALNGSQLKNRIIMMKKKTENKFKVVRQLVVLPLLAILVMGLSNKEVKNEFLQSTAKVEVIVDGKVIPADDEKLSQVDFSNGINSMDVITALNINNVVANGLNFDREVPILYIRTSDYVPGTDLDFEENTSTSIGIGNTSNENINRTERQYYAIDNKIVSKAEFEEKGKIGFENVIMRSGNSATDKYGEKYKNVADAITGVPNFVIKNIKEEVGARLEIDPKDGALQEKGSSSRQNSEDGVTLPNNPLPTEAEWENAASKVNRIIRGKITDKDGNPIVQAFVVQYDKPGGRSVVGVVTDINGAFVIKLATNDETLHISKSGYQSKEVNVEGKEEISVELEKDSGASKDKSGYSISGGLKGTVSPDGNMKITSSTNEGLNVRIRKNGINEDQPFILINGVPYNFKADGDIDFGTANIEEFGKLINVAPENIESIEVLKDAASVAIWGESAKNGVLLIKTKRKDGAINSIPELRNFIAREIKFPVDAQDELNDQLNMRFYVRVNNKGEITDIGENIGGDGEIFPVDEIVVTALRPKNVVKEKDIKNGNLMAKEAERVLNKLPDIEIPEAKGKILEFWFKFVLQE